jgi:hypothetical protein
MHSILSSLEALDASALLQDILIVPLDARGDKVSVLCREKGTLNNDGTIEVRQVESIKSPETVNFDDILLSTPLALLVDWLRV